MLRIRNALNCAWPAQPLPDGAERGRAGYEVQGGQPVFVARWRHVHDGVPAERDFIQVSINGRTGKVFAVHRLWHELGGSAAVR